MASWQRPSCSASWRAEAEREHDTALKIRASAPREGRGEASYMESASLYHQGGAISGHQEYSSQRALRRSVSAYHRSEAWASVQPLIKIARSRSIRTWSAAWSLAASASIISRASAHNKGGAKRESPIKKFIYGHYHPIWHMLSARA